MYNNSSSVKTETAAAVVTTGGVQVAYPAIAAITRVAGGSFEFDEVELDTLRDNEVLVRIEACGICHTDRKFQDRLPLPAVFGHEGTGIVEETGPAVRLVAPGDRVIISYPWCGECPSCRHHEPFRCENIPGLKFGGHRADGSATIRLKGDPVSSAFFQQSSFATRAIALEHALVPVDGDTDPEILAALPCGVQTGAGAVLNTFAMDEHHSLVMFGVGTVGLSAIMTARMVGAKVRIAVDVVPQRLELARSLGATHAFDAREEGLVRRIREVLPRGASHCLESSIQAEALEAAIECLGQGGKVGVFSAPPPGQKFPFTTRGLFDRVASLHGIVQGFSIPREFLPQLIRWQRSGDLPFERLVTVYDFRDIDQAFSDTEAGSVVKAVLRMNGSG